MEDLNIYILISTIGNRIQRVPEILLAPRRDLTYIVSWQTGGSQALPGTLQEREDVKISTINSRGLSLNRNNAIRFAQEIIDNAQVGTDNTRDNADNTRLALTNRTNCLMILADDDVRFQSEWLDNLKTLAKTDKDTDLFVLQALTMDARPLHYYPDKPFVYPRVPRGFYFNSMGMVMRTGRPWPTFDSRFGLGAPRLKMGEEDIFIHDCHNKGLKICYYPQPLLMTAAITTSSAYNSDSALQMSKGAVLTLLHGRFLALPRILLTAIKMRNRVRPLPHLINMLKGRAYIIKTPSLN